MGYKLRRRLRELLGPEIVGLPRAVALEISDDANDDTRESRADLVDLAKWTGAKNEKAVRDALLRLAKQGWEFRIPISVGADGRPVYAVRGRALRFRVPPFADPEAQEQHGEGPNPVGPSLGGKDRTESALTAERAEPSHLKGRTQSPKGPNPVGPLSSGPLLSPLSLVDLPTQLVGETGLVPAGDERETVEQIKNAYPDRSPGWWRKIAANGDLAQIVADQRSAQTDRPAQAPPWCESCGGGNPAARTNVRFRTSTGMPGGIPCPNCHPLTTDTTTERNVS